MIQFDPTIEFTPTPNSSNVAGIRYDDENQTLYVKFRNGMIYAYYGVHESVYDDMFSAPSMGKFVNQHLKAQYPYNRVD
jgi:hypothetical protein